MKIAYIVPSLANKGPVIVVQELCRGLTAAGHSCKVYYFDDIVELEMPCPAERIRFKNRIDFSQWDIVHSHMLRPDLWVWLRKPRFVKQHTRFITTVHQNIKETLTSDYGFIKGVLTGYLWKLALKRFDKVVVLTREHIASLPGIKEAKKHIIFNGRNIDTGLEIDDTDKIVIAGLRSKYRTILGSTSIITKRKGLEQIINALPFLPDCGYVIVGDGPELENLKSLASELGVSDQCAWIGMKADGYRYTAYFDIYLIMSRSEGFPLSLIEAAAYGKPIVCADIPIFKAIVTDKEVTFTPLDNTKKLVETIKRVDASREKKTNSLKIFYHARLTEDVMCGNYEKFYKSL